MKVEKLFRIKRLGPLLRFICSQARRDNVSLYLVGGAVRDILLKRDVKDVDFCIEGNAFAFASSVARALRLKIVHHPRFQTATLFYQNGYIDFATARKEFYPHSGALPVISQSRLADDLFRRDFSINAMAVSFKKENFGTLIDCCRGLEDLKNKKIRVLHENSFRDDPTRILRAVRFEQRFGFKIEAQTLRFLKAALKSKLEKNVAKERYFEEFRKILFEPKCFNMIKRLKSLGGLSFISSQACQLRYLSAVEKILLGYGKKNSLNENQKALIRLMGLVDGLGQSSQIVAKKGFSFRREEEKVILQNQSRLAIITAVCQKGILPSQAARILKKFEREVVIYWYTTSSSKNFRSILKCFMDCDSLVQLKISGADVQKLGCPFGVKVGEILAKVLDRKIDKGLPSKVSEIKMAAEIISKG